MKWMFYFFAFIYFLASCSSREGFFSDMPLKYDVDQLPYYKDVFINLRTEVFSDGDKLRVRCNGWEHLIPFCGILEYRKDSVFFYNESDGLKKLFLVIGEPEMSTRRIKFNDGLVSEIKFIHMTTLPGFKDKVALYQMKPLQRGLPSDADRLNYIAIGRGGIKLLGFSAGLGGETNIELFQTPKVLPSR
ncbi:MAG TPA: hypothetical protein DGG95_11875 [Cytophagales bacterium]|jgi:hypothetical protein|nr:hypothetical protein [Cytophagales bacterium]